MEYRKTIEYEEEDGYIITRDDKNYYVCGDASAEYELIDEPDVPYLRNGDPGYPGTHEINIDSDIEFNNTEVYDEDGNKVDIELTDEEKQGYEQYMEMKLDDAANEDEWIFDDYDEPEPDYEPDDF